MIQVDNNEPLISREEQRRDIFSNSMSQEVNEWLCPVCAFENRPHAANCSLCGATQGTANRYYNGMRRQQRDLNQGGGPQGGGAADLSDVRVTLVAPPGSGPASQPSIFAVFAGGAALESGESVGSARGSLLGEKSSPLTHGERAQAFMVTSKLKSSPPRLTIPHTPHFSPSPPHRRFNPGATTFKTLTCARSVGSTP